MFEQEGVTKIITETVNNQGVLDFVERTLISVFAHSPHYTFKPEQAHTADLLLKMYVS